MTLLIGFIFVIILLFGVIAFRGAPYVPSRRQDVATAFDALYKLTEADVLVDIGSGDGIVLRMAARRGAKAIGYELNPLLVWLSRWLSRDQKRVTIHLADFWLVKLPTDTTIVYTFGEGRDIANMAAKVASEATRLGRPLLFISYGFRLKDDAPLKTVGAHHLYRFEPLQSGKA